MLTKLSTERVVIHRRQRGFLGSAKYGFTGSDTSTPENVVLASSRTGQSNPNWKAQIRKGENASTPLSATSQTFVARPVAYSLYFRWPTGGPGGEFMEGDFKTSGFYAGSSYNLFTNHLSGFTPDSAVVAEANAKAIKSLYIKIRGVQSQFAGGVFLGELKKTLKMIANPAKALRDSMLLHKRKVTKIVNGRNVQVKGSKPPWTVKELKSIVAGSYLEATFGWQPLLSDIEDASKALQRLLNEKPMQRFRAFGQAEKEIFQSVDTMNGFGVPYYFQNIVEKRVGITVYYGSFQGFAPNEKLKITTERIVNLSGFNLRDFVPTIWELIPYSFLVDYFSNIGDVLSALNTDTSIVGRITRVDIEEKRVAMSVNANHAHVLLWIKANFPSPYGIVQSGGIGTYELVTRTLSRTPTSVPFLLPRLKMPDLFSRQSLNIAALLAGGRPPRR